jgi:uncharacterized repeat protein (TIGR03803 family)
MWMCSRILVLLCVVAMTSCGRVETASPLPSGLYSQGETPGAIRGSQVDVGQRKRSNASYKLVYTFQGGTDGAVPSGGLTSVNGMLYGTTAMGGGARCGFKRGCGVVFALNPNLSSGQESVAYRFQGGSDGAEPYSNLIDVNDALYGTTSAGGAGPSGGNGTAFTFDPSPLSHQESVLYRFQGGQDGAAPVAGLMGLNGTLYGTTLAGGGDGTVFELNASGRESVLYRFKGGRNGREPQASLIAMSDTLYGTTTGGGLYPNLSSCNSLGCGTVFALNLSPSSGKERVVYRFRGGNDGAYPGTSLLDVNGKLYGTTARGGGYGCKNSGGVPLGCGTVYVVNPSSRHDHVVYRFQGGTDGASPAASLIDVNGILYGTTSGGGGTRCHAQGCGTVFALDPSTGQETILYRFQGQKDGADPDSDLLDVNGTLYGTTVSGGGGCSYNEGCGTIFAVTP